jgi:hypothetical protein
MEHIQKHVVVASGGNQPAFGMAVDSYCCWLLVMCPVCVQNASPLMLLVTHLHEPSNRHVFRDVLHKHKSHQHSEHGGRALVLQQYKPLAIGQQLKNHPQGLGILVVASNAVPRLCGHGA